MAKKSTTTTTAAPVAEEEKTDATKKDDDKKDSDDAVAAAVVEEATKDDDEADDGHPAMPDTPGGSKRRFFPRVKHLLTREWELFLVGVLSAMETSGACKCAAASHKPTNPWYKGFDLVYNGVATECSVPTGKNRYHKFKDKIVELWIAMETQAPDDHPLKARSMEQLTAYRQACEEANRKETTKPPPKTPSTPTKASGAPSASNKRSYASTYHGAPLKWKNLDESSALKSLPEPLQSLVHLRNLGSEVGKKDEGVEAHYQKALEEYCKQTSEDKDGLYARSLALATLSRQSQNVSETKTITDAYEQTVKDYIMQIDPSAAVV